MAQDVHQYLKNTKTLHPIINPTSSYSRFFLVEYVDHEADDLSKAEKTLKVFEQWSEQVALHQSLFT